MELVGASYRVAKPHRWTGFNLESHRRKAAAGLLRRLRDFERRGIDYRLVGHSHGGSVIWHALVASAAAGTRLKGLKGWVTVGAPFLSFAPDPVAWWRYPGLVACAGALFYISDQIAEGWQKHAQIMRNAADAGFGAQAYILLTVVLVIALVLRSASLLLGVIRHLRGLFRHSTAQAAEKTAGAWYGSSWLALWHERDEAIAGLRATLVSPARLLPRWAAPTASRVRRFASLAYDEGIARALDEFVWSVGMGRAQGADIFDQRLTRAWHCPEALSPGWACLPSPLSGKMVEAADAGAGSAVAAFRERLALAGNLDQAEQVFSSFGASLTWQELIHTGYFGQDLIARTVSNHIVSRPVVRTGDPDVDRLQEWRSARAPGPESPERRPSRPVALAVNRALTASVVTVLLAIAAFSSYRAAVFPYTDDFVVDKIAAEFTQLDFIQTKSIASLGEGMVRLAALGRLTDFRRIVDGAGDSDQRLEAVKPLARAVGRLSPDVAPFFTPDLIRHLEKDDEIRGARQNWRKRVADNPLDAFIDAVPVYPRFPLGAEVLSGVVDGKKDIPSSLLKNVLGQVFRQRAGAPGKYSDAIALLAADLYGSGHTQEADQLVENAFEWNGTDLTYCPATAIHVRRAAALESIEGVIKLSGLCRQQTVSPDYLLQGMQAAYAAGKLQTAGALLDRLESPASAAGFPTFLREALLVQIGRNRVPDAMLLLLFWNRELAGNMLVGDLDRAMEVLNQLRGMPPAKDKNDAAMISAMIAGLTDTIASSLRKSMNDPKFVADEVTLLAKDLASFLVALDRLPEAKALAEEFARRAAQKMPADSLVAALDVQRRAEESAQAGSLYLLVNERATGLRHLRDALSQIQGIPSDLRYEVACVVYRAVATTEPALARRAVNIALEQAAIEPGVERRTGMIRDLANHAASSGNARLAMSLAERVGLPALSADTYALILDRTLAEESPALHERWGFGAGSRGQPSYNLNCAMARR